MRAVLQLHAVHRGHGIGALLQPLHHAAHRDRTQAAHGRAAEYCVEGDLALVDHGFEVQSLVGEGVAVGEDFQVEVKVVALDHDYRFRRRPRGNGVLEARMHGVAQHPIGQPHGILVGRNRVRRRDAALGIFAGRDKAQVLVPFTVVHAELVAAVDHGRRRGQAAQIPGFLVHDPIAETGHLRGREFVDGYCGRVYRHVRAAVLVAPGRAAHAAILAQHQTHPRPLGHGRHLLTADKGLQDPFPPHGTRRHARRVL